LNKNRSRYEIMGLDAIGSAGGLIIIWNPEEIHFSNWMSLPRILSGTASIVGMKEEVIITGGVWMSYSERKGKLFAKSKSLAMPHTRKTMDSRRGF